MQVEGQYQQVGQYMGVEHADAHVQNKEQHHIHSNQDGECAVPFKFVLDVLEQWHSLLIKECFVSLPDEHDNRAYDQSADMTEVAHLVVGTV